ncbi:unnamed protein product, partial [Polarella glacialis]
MAYVPLHPAASNEFAHVKSVGVIGAGVAGLQMARACLAHGLKVTVFDKAPKVGGLWQSNYHSYGVQVPKEFYEFPDFPSPLAAGDYPTGAQTQAYIESYAQEFKLLPHIKLKHSVVALEQRAKGQKGFVFIYKTETGADQAEEFDFAVVASGMYSQVRNMPDWAASKGGFGGDVIHSSQYLEQATAKGKKVLVIGCGKSAIDIVVSVSEVSKEPPTLLFRNAHWCTPRLIAGFIPFQYVFLSRFGQGLVSWYKGPFPDGACILSCSEIPHEFQRIDKYYFGHWDKAGFVKRNQRNYIYSQRALAEAEMAKSGKVPDRMKIFLTTTYAEYTDLIPVQDVDLCFSLLIFVAKSIFSDVHGMFDKYEVGEKGHMVQEEWNELCLNLPLRLNQQSMDEMWNFISSVHASGVRDVTDIDFTACMHVHDIEARDSWIVRLTEALSLDYYDMSVSEMESRIRGKSSKEASPVLDYNADEYALEHRDELLQDTVRPPSSGRGTQGTSLSQPFGLLEVANPASAEGEGDPFGKLKALQNKVSLNDFERRETLHLEEELSDSESSQSSVDSNPLSMDSESEMSEFDAQAFLSQQAPELQSMTSAPSKPVNIVVNSDESWRKLME